MPFGDWLVRVQEIINQMGLDPHGKGQFWGVRFIQTHCKSLHRSKKINNGISCDVRSEQGHSLVTWVLLGLGG